MEIVERVRETERTFPNVVLTLGSFDGVHLGHRVIIDRVVERAKVAKCTAAILTMKPHPREFFSPEHAPNLLTCDTKKLELFDQAGIGVVFVLAFDAETAAMSPQDFVEQILHERCGAKHMVVGHDCRFGKGAKGDFAFLVETGATFGFTVEQVPALIVDGERVSSTLIRERILQGDLADAERFLGRKYSIVGEVIHGRGIGEKIGFPTANIKPHHSATPAQGVYIAEAVVRGKRLPAAVNIGIAPTIRHEDLTIEAHLLDFHEDIAGESIEIVFHRRVRPEMKFNSIGALIEQIAKDVGETRAYFGLD